MYGYDVKTLAEGVYLIYETANEVTMYLVCGSERAALIDTGCGEGDLPSLVSSLTELPLDVIITHGHGDHYMGAFMFDEAYIDMRDIELTKGYAEELAEEAQSIPELMRLIELGPPKYLPMRARFELGGRTLTTIDLAGHTPGSVGFLLNEDRIFFTGDGLTYNVWMQLDEALTIEDYMKTLCALSPYEGKFDLICNGHARGADPASHLERVRALVKDVIARQPGEWLEQEYPGFLAEGEGCQMLYLKEKVHGTKGPAAPNWR